jgi:hypothetical protein
MKPRVQTSGVVWLDFVDILKKQTRLVQFYISVGFRTINSGVER